MFASDNYINKAQDIDFKRTVVKFIKDLKEFQSDKNNQLNEIMKKEMIWIHTFVMTKDIQT